MKPLFYRQLRIKGINRVGKSVDFTFILRSNDLTLTTYRFFKLFDPSSLELPEALYASLIPIFEKGERRITNHVINFIPEKQTVTNCQVYYIRRVNQPLIVRLFLRFKYMFFPTR